MKFMVEIDRDGLCCARPIESNESQFEPFKGLLHC